MGGIRSVKNFIYVVNTIRKAEKPLSEIIHAYFHDEVYKRVTRDIFINTSFVNNPDSCMLWDEYIGRGMALNDFAFRDSLNVKKYLFKRIPDLMKRGFLVASDASDLEITEFLKKYKRVAGKCNLRRGKGFGSYSVDDKDAVTKIRSDKVELLEEWIEQHEEYAKLNPTSINTLRIHTIRNTNGCKTCLFNQLSIGSAGMINNMASKGQTNYDLKIAEDGKIECSIRCIDSKRSLCDRHLDNGYRFVKGSTLPYVKEAYELCLKAAEKIPEFKFIGWDVAFTPKGPLIVEANVLSGALVTQQTIESFTNGKGLRQEIIEALDFGMEGIVYDKSCNLYAEPFADLSYLDEDDQPNALQQFLVLLESAIHNHGVVFYEEPPKKANCVIQYVPEDNSLKLRKGNEECHLEMPEFMPDNIYEADKLARVLAEKIYASLLEMK